MNNYEVHLYPVVEGVDPQMATVSAQMFAESEAGYSFYDYEEDDQPVLVHYFPREVVFFIATVA